MGIIENSSIDSTIERLNRHDYSSEFIDYILSLTKSIDAVGVIFIQDDDGMDRYVFVACGMSGDEWATMSPHDRRICVNTIPLFDLSNGYWVIYQETGLDKS
jgi:hypothetical protein